VSSKRACYSFSTFHTFVFFCVSKVKSFSGCAKEQKKEEEELRRKFEGEKALQSDQTIAFMHPFTLFIIICRRFFSQKKKGHFQTLGDSK